MRIFHLERFAHIFGQRFIICDFHHQRSDVTAEALLQFLLRDTGLLYGVVQECCHHQVCIQDIVAAGHKLRDFNQVVDIRFASFAFALLSRVAFTGKTRRGEDSLNLGGAR
jgi:hypothetical protein